MSNQYAVSFRERFQKAYDNSSFTSYRSLSLASGWTASRIHSILTGNFDDSVHGPGFFGVARTCQQLGVTPDYLAGINKWQMSKPSDDLNALTFVSSLKQANTAPSIKELMRLYVRSGKRLEAFTDYIDRCDIYEEPIQENRSVTVRSVGKRSLAALRMGEANPLILQEAYDTASAEFREQIFKSHERALQRGITVEPDAIDQVMSNKPVHVKIDYIRVAMHLSDASGKGCILIYCELIPQ